MFRVKLLLVETEVTFILGMSQSKKTQLKCSKLLECFLTDCASQVITLFPSEVPPLKAACGLQAVLSL